MQESPENTKTLNNFLAFRERRTFWVFARKSQFRNALWFHGFENFHFMQMERLFRKITRLQALKEQKNKARVQKESEESDS